MAVDKQNLVWLDLEMTGLDPKCDVILEIATIITDANLNIIAQGPVIAISQSDETLANMNPWCIEQHGKSGLTERCRQSTITLQQAQQQTIDFVSQYVEKGVSPMCGNSIGQDRRFINAYMAEFESWFHYRNIDVSTIKELVRRWQPELLNKVQKTGTHLALDDIRESIEELRTYRQYVFKI
ncbi:oligoribonuclease [Thalassotalea ponticola]|uniref:oligoribonuclease n=1 Tax=Thalassotalea ponticola TaxID=1523392 RepID=UPI0025B3EFF0|nr:oligoribonuclease [Thalassotalea ponticola]MDN3653009.1 oligoribonuclease [Thalassotalea ponticola]